MSSFNSKERSTKHAAFHSMANSTSGTTGKAYLYTRILTLAHRHVRYYDRLYVEKTLDLDESLVKEYFPVSVVVPTILKIYQDLLGVKFIEVKDDTKDVWHPGEWD